MDIAEVQKQNIILNIFKYCCSKEHVQEIVMEEANLSNVGANLLIGSILKLKTVNFKYSKIAKNDLLLIFSMIPYSQSLKSINFSSMDFSNIPPRMLHEASKYLEKLHLNHSRLDVEQCKGLIEGLKSNLQMTSLGLGGQQCLKQLPKEMLTNMITQNMKCLDSREANLNPSQLETILKLISKLPTMSSLYLKRSIFTEVDTIQY